MTAAFSVDVEDCPLDSWETPARGTLRWRTLLSAPQTASENLVCGVAELRPGEFFAPHHHAEPEVYFGLEGAGCIMIDGKPFDLRPGVALFIPSHAVHGIPQVTQSLRFFYTFAVTSFDDIRYHFLHEGADDTRT